MKLLKFFFFSKMNLNIYFKLKGLQIYIIFIICFKLDKYKLKKFKILYFINGYKILIYYFLKLFKIEIKNLYYLIEEFV